MNDNLLLLGGNKVSVQNSKQVKLIMNLPVRVISDEKVIDILPLELDPNMVYVKKFKKRLLGPRTYLRDFTPDEMTIFFHSCSVGDLYLMSQVCNHYGVCKSTIARWAALGRLKRYQLTSTFTVYKVSELPTLEALYNWDN